MLRVSSSVVILLGLVLCIPSLQEAKAQQFSESGGSYEAARNKVGLLRYCRSNRLLDPVLASRAIVALETDLGEPPSDSLARERGDRAQQTGEDGVWGADGGRDIASAAKLLIRTTPEDLCQEWAEGTLRMTQDSRKGGTTIAVVTPTQPSKPPARIELSPSQPIQIDTSPDGTNAAVKTGLFALPPTPPLPEKSPLRSAGGEVASLPRTTPTGSTLASAIGGASGPTGGTKAASPSATPAALGQAAPPLPAPRADEVAGSLAGEQTASATSPSVWKKWPFNRLGKTERCLMAGCKWTPPRERRALGD